MENTKPSTDTNLNSLTNSLNGNVAAAKAKPWFLFTKGNLYLAAIAANLNIVSVGVVAAFTAPAIADMRREGSRFANITSSQLTWIASLPGISAVFGSLLASYLSNKWGRKTVLMLVSVPFVAGWLMVAYAPGFGWMYAGRLLCGLSNGVCAVAVPAYVTEVASMDLRGTLGCCFQLSFATGVLLTMTIGIACRWSWLAIVGAFFAATAPVLMFFVPESPPWLISEGRLGEAFAALRLLKGLDKDDSDTTREYTSAIDHFARQPLRTFSFREFREPHMYKPLSLAVGLVFFQQFSGISAFLAYTVEIFEHAESALDPAIAAAAVATVQVLATVVGITLMDRAGRRTLFLVSGGFVTLGLAILGVYGIVRERHLLDSPVMGWIPLVGFMLFIAAFSLGYGPLPYLMTPEFVPMHSRSFVLAISGVFSACFLFIVTKTFDDLRLLVSDYGVYWIYGLFSLLGCVFGWFCLPETKKKTITDIQYEFSSSFMRTPYEEI